MKKALRLDPVRLRRRPLPDQARELSREAPPHWVAKNAHKFDAVDHPQKAKVWVHQEGAMIHAPVRPEGGVQLPLRKVQSDALSFVVVGDTGKNTPGQFATARAMAKKAGPNELDSHFTVHVGDAFYEHGADGPNDPRFESLFEKLYGRPLPGPTYFIFGNHEYGTRIRAGDTAAVLAHAQKPNTEMTFPSRYYTADYQLADGQRVGMFFLDTSVWASDPAQRAWFEKAIRESKANWKIVFGHHPVYSYGLHGHSGHLKEQLLPTLEKHADLYVAGHDHDQQMLRSNRGLPLLITGAGGEARRVGTGRKALFTEGTMGFSSVAVKGKTLSLKIHDSAGDERFSTEVQQGRKGKARMATPAPVSFWGRIEGILIGIRAWARAPRKLRPPLDAKKGLRSVLGPEGFSAS